MVDIKDTRGKAKTETSLMGEAGDEFIPKEMIELFSIHTT